MEVKKRESLKKRVIDRAQGCSLSPSVSKMGLTGKWVGDEIKDQKHVYDVNDVNCLYRIFKETYGKSKHSIEEKYNW